MARCRYWPKEKEAPCVSGKFDCMHHMTVKGLDPQSGKSVDTKMCSDLAQVKIMLENNKMTLQQTSSFDKLTNVVDKHRSSVDKFSKGIQQIPVKMIK